MTACTNIFDVLIISGTVNRIKMGSRTLSAGTSLELAAASLIRLREIRLPSLMTQPIELRSLAAD